jgi:hypothetical protein
VHRRRLQRLSDDAGWPQEGEYTSLHFILGAYYVQLTLRALEQPPVALDVARHFGRVIARKLKARIEATAARGPG